MAEKMGWIGSENPEDEEFYDDDVDYEYEDDEYQPEQNYLPTSSRFRNEEENMDISRIVTVRPTSYAEVQLIGDSFREGTPVIVNLTDTADHRRIIDFCAGLIYGLHGTIEEITPQVILLSPETVKVQGKVGGSVRRGDFF
ncbi:cell division protein SepF [Gleimia coleocanis]|nr:cell division protein SepF [Gleimia coleocanis]